MRSVSAPEGETPSALMTSERRRAPAPSRPCRSQDLPPPPPPPLNVGRCRTQTTLDGTLQDVNFFNKTRSGGGGGHRQWSRVLRGISCHLRIRNSRRTRAVSPHHGLSVKAQHPDTHPQSSDAQRSSSLLPLLKQFFAVFLSCRFTFEAPHNRQ